MTCPPGAQARRAAAISHSVLALSLQHQRSVSRKYLPSARREGEGWRRKRALDAAAAAAASANRLSGESGGSGEAPLRESNERQSEPKRYRPVSPSQQHLA